MKRISGGQLSRKAKATLLSSHAGGPRAATGDTSFTGQAKQSTQQSRVSPPPARRTYRSGRTSPPKPPRTLTVTAVSWFRPKRSLRHTASRQCRILVRRGSLSNGTSFYVRFGEMLHDGDDGVCCHLCGRWMKAVGGTHLRWHGWTTDDYPEAFGWARRRQPACPVAVRVCAARRSAT